MKKIKKSSTRTFRSCGIEFKTATTSDCKPTVWREYGEKVWEWYVVSMYIDRGFNMPTM